MNNGGSEGFIATFVADFDSAMKTSLRSPLLLTLGALIWGVAFVAQSEGSNYMGSATFIGIRFLLGALVLLPFIRLSERRRTVRETPAEKKACWRAGAICGFWLFVASFFQQEGIALGASAGKAGFITAIYIVIVPILGLILYKKRTGLAVWIGVVISLAGLYLLCVTGEFALQKEDILMLLCAFTFSFQILAIDRFSPQFNALKLAAVQFLVCGTLGVLVAIPVDIASAGFAAWAAPLASWPAWISLLYAGILSSAVGYTLQIVGQKGFNPTVASMLMSLESVFAVLAGWLILHQTMTLREAIGAALVFVAVIIAQLRKTD